METAVTTTTRELKTYVDNKAIQKRFEDVLGKRAQAFIVSLLSIAGQSKDLMNADPASVVNAAMTAATLDLPINQNLGFAYIIPYKGAAQFQMGYKGFVQLAMRSGQFSTINVSDVREGEIQEIDRLTGEIKYTWVTEGRDKLKVIGYVAYFRLINGFSKSFYMTAAEMRSHGMKYSQTYKKGFGLWESEFDVMAKKTVLKLLLSKYAPLTTAMQKAQLADQAIIKGDDEYEYVDNEHETPAEIAKNKERERLTKHIDESKTLEELSKCQDYIDPEDTDLVEKYDAKALELEEKK